MTGSIYHLDLKTGMVMLLVIRPELDFEVWPVADGWQDKVRPHRGSMLISIPKPGKMVLTAGFSGKENDFNSICQFQVLFNWYI
jgi:hypothetical protein